MKLPVKLRSVAQEEAAEAARWYEGKQTGLGADFLNELERVLNRISEQSDRYPVILGDTREAPLHRFPYCIYYRERHGRVVVTAVFHTSRDPSVWQGRS